MTVNVLVDRHHGGLYRSLQLLADRLGWTLYTPVGLEWEQERYWAFGMNQGITDRLAEQYLVPHEGVWGRVDGLGHVYVTLDPEFPPSPHDPAVFAPETIFGVTLEAARRMDWAYVIASLDDNQWGFSRFAHEVGARFVVQVGNTGQYVAWNLQPLALVSSEVPIVGQGVRYHQEMDPAVRQYRPPVGASGAASFVNCMPSMGHCWDLLTEAQSLGLDVAVHGIDGPQGVVKPIQALADRMAASAWAWHCKAHGDGYGHVIFSWAAIGRPLVGHASHYRGKLAEPLWEDGVTCIDLDRHSVAEAVATIRETTPEQHEAMCRAIRAEFDRIDWDGEAQAIRELLA